MDTNFTMAGDWIQITPLGEFPHPETGVMQLIDASATQSMVDRFWTEAKEPNFPGVLIDFDHSSFDSAKPTAAAGWITALENRKTGLWGKVRWSGEGLKAVSGGSYRLISPTWLAKDCAFLTDKLVRPTRLSGVALCNTPNLKGMTPISNTAQTHQGTPGRVDPGMSFSDAVSDFKARNPDKSFEYCWNRVQRENPQLYQAFEAGAQSQAGLSSTPEAAAGNANGRDPVYDPQTGILPLLVNRTRERLGCNFETAWNMTRGLYPQVFDNRYRVQSNCAPMGMQDEPSGVEILPDDAKLARQWEPDVVAAIEADLNRTDKNKIIFQTWRIKGPSVVYDELRKRVQDVMKAKGLGVKAAYEDLKRRQPFFTAIAVASQSENTKRQF